MKSNIFARHLKQNLPAKIGDRKEDYDNWEMMASLLHQLALSALLKTARDKINIKTALFFILQISNKITSPLCTACCLLNAKAPLLQTS
jgi:hypothetical protein